MKRKKIIFRADGNSKTGLGHLYRVFALVEMLSSDYDYVLLTRDDSELIVIPESYNFEIIPLKIDIINESKWLSKTYDVKSHLILVDGYSFNSEYQKKIKEEGYKLIYIDDLAKSEMFADVVVNHSLSVSIRDFDTSENIEYALGSKYAILRPEFLKKAKFFKKAKLIKSVFICFGGADFNNLTLKALRAVLNINAIKEINIVLGKAYKELEIFQLIKENEHKVFLHQNLNEKEMVSLMDRCELGIMPSSTIAYESCSAKMIILSGHYIDNQMAIYRGLVKNNLIYAAGDLNKITEEKLKNLILSILNKSINEYQEMLNSQGLFFDGNQKKRFLDLIEKLDYAS